jgi:aspartate carbamoyltransferase catalytic subunit
MIFTPYRLNRSGRCHANHQKRAAITYKRQNQPCYRCNSDIYADIDEYLRLRDAYILNPEKLASAKSDMIILHPLPRVNEISVAIDNDPRAVYFKQALYGKYMRMALILKLLNIQV